MQTKSSYINHCPVPAHQIPSPKTHMQNNFPAFSQAHNCTCYNSIYIIAWEAFYTICKVNRSYYIRHVRSQEHDISGLIKNENVLYVCSVAIKCVNVMVGGWGSTCPSTLHKCDLVHEDSQESTKQTLLKHVNMGGKEGF